MTGAASSLAGGETSALFSDGRPVRRNSNQRHGPGARRRRLASDDSPAVHLIGGRHRGEGNVETVDQGFWGAVCDDGWDLAAATVVCRELGFARAEHATAQNSYATDPTIGFWFALDDARCAGVERKLSQCAGSRGGTSDCKGAYEWAGVRCALGSCASPELAGPFCCPAERHGRYCCPAGTAGPDCSLSDELSCLGSGTVDDDGKCDCLPGFKGGQCQYTNERSCNGNGNVTDTGFCQCEPGFSQPDCAELAAEPNATTTEPARFERPAAARSQADGPGAEVGESGMPWYAVFLIVFTAFVAGSATWGAMRYRDRQLAAAGGSKVAPAPATQAGVVDSRGRMTSDSDYYESDDLVASMAPVPVERAGAVPLPQWRTPSAGVGPRAVRRSAWEPGATSGRLHALDPVGEAHGQRS